jgi:hypothetical protein
VHEGIGTTVVGLDEAIALGGVEPFDCSGLQGSNLMSECTPGNTPRRETVSTCLLESSGPHRGAQLRPATLETDLRRI